MTTRSTTYFRPAVERDGVWVPFAKQAWENIEDARTDGRGLLAGGETEVHILQQVVTVDETDVETLTP